MEAENTQEEKTPISLDSGRAKIYLGDYVLWHQSGRYAGSPGIYKVIGRTKTMIKILDAFPFDGHAYERNVYPFNTIRIPPKLLNIELLDMIAKTAYNLSDDLGYKEIDEIRKSFNLD